MLGNEKFWVNIVENELFFQTSLVLYEIGCFIKKLKKFYTTKFAW